MSNMSNSFYYFFSATPQVLGAITGLFGVIVIFQIQKIRKQLIGIAQNITKILKEEVKEKVCDFKTNDEIIKELEYGIIIDEMTIITHYLNDIKNPVSNVIDNSIFLYSIYKNYLNEIINKSINATLISIITIIFSLILIPFGEIIINNIFLIVLSFSIIVISLIVCCILYFLLFKNCINLQELKYPIERDFIKEKNIPVMADVEIDGKIYH